MMDELPGAPGVDVVVERWLRTIPPPPTDLVDGVVRRLPRTPQRSGRWRLQVPRRLHARALARLPATGAALALAVLALRAVVPVSPVQALGERYGLILTEEVEPSVAQVLRDDAGHDLMATWPAHRRDIDRLAVGADGAVWVSSTAHGADNDLLAGPQLWRLGVPGWHDAGRSAPGFTSDVAVADDGTVWVVGDGAAAFDGTAWGAAASSGVDGLLSSVAPGPDGTAWAVGSVAGRAVVLHHDGSRWDDRSGDPGLADLLPRNAARAVAVDGAGTVWVGLDAEGGGGAGLLRLAGDRWELVRPLGSLGEDASHDVFALTVGPDGSLWALLDSPFYRTATDFRLARWDGQTWTAWTSADGLPPDATPWGGAPSAMTVGPDGVAWFTREGGGLVSFDGTDSRRVLTDLEVSDLAAGPDGTVWVATQQGAGSRGGLYAILP